VSADWLDQRLSVLDLDLLLAGTSYDEALHGVVDLAGHLPGPLEVELTPDGTIALVAISPGFFAGPIGATIGYPEVPKGGALVIVDLTTLREIATLAPAHVPMGIAISPDGARAYTANYGDDDAPGTTMSVIDITTPSILEDIEVGQRPEQIALSPDGSLGLLNLAGDGAVRAFQTSDPASTLSPPLPVADDPSGVAFLTDALAIVANSQGATNYTLLDLSDPTAPTIAEQGPMPGGIPYGATSLGADAAIVSTLFDALLISRINPATPSAITSAIEIPELTAFPLGMAYDGDGHGLIAAAGAHAVHIVNLESATLSATIPWPGEGPSYLAIHP
jgi:YVTN family beta-propeller protein